MPRPQAEPAAELGRLLDQAEHLHALAEWLERQGPPEAWLAAGCVVQSVWNLLTDRPANQGILDYDVAYYDADLSEQTESGWIDAMTAAFPQTKLDIKNQARVHLWYPRKFGVQIPPFVSVSAAMATWTTTATATAARRRQGRWELLAPFGLDDLLELVLRPNRSLIDAKIYAAKASRWQALWPELRILPWEQAVGPFQLNQPLPQNWREQP